MSLRGTRVIDREVWSYTTLLSDVIEPFEPVVGDAESVELAWVPVADVTELPLHPGFGHAWPAIADLLRTPRIVIVVDAANVVGSVPNGWWKNRLAAAQELIRRLGVLAATGFPADRLELDATTWNVDVDVIVEGAARGAHTPAEQPGSDALHVVAARGEGDDALVKQVQTRVAEGARVVVVTSDRQLRARVGALGAQYRGAGWLREILPD